MAVKVLKNYDSLVVAVATDKTVSPWQLSLAKSGHDSKKTKTAIRSLISVGQMSLPSCLLFEGASSVCMCVGQLNKNS